jgi:hypothetical protein
MAMDRDMVNCLHYLFHNPTLTRAEATKSDGKDPKFWCAWDTSSPLIQGGILAETLPSQDVGFAPGILTLINMIEEQLKSMPKPNYAFGYPIGAPIRQKGARRPAFLAIPYRPEFDLVKAAVLDSAKQAGFDCEVTGDRKSPGFLMDQVWQGIRGSDVVVADITGNNPNVVYEVGLAHALGKEVILLSQEKDAPFDVRHTRLETYDPNKLVDLKRNLLSAFKAVTARYPHEGPEPKF